MNEFVQITSTWVEVSKSAIEHNIALYKSVVGTAKLAVVIKSNAYGCDLLLVAKLLENNHQVDYLCVFSLSEALFLRRQGITKPILVLGVLDASLDQAFIHDIDLTVYDLNTVLKLDQVAKLLDKKIKVHVKIDTGMSRLGISSTQALPFILKLAKLPTIKINGLFTHYAASDQADLSYTKQQLQTLQQLVTNLNLAKIKIPLLHASNTAAVTSRLPDDFNMIRVGIGAYGLWPSVENRLITQRLYPNFNLKLALSWQTVVLTVKELSPGSYVGYDLVYQAKKAMQVATIAVGYYDGYDRRLANGGQVLVQGRLVPIIGNIAMNMTMIDVTGLVVSPGDQVTLLADWPAIHPDDLAKTCATGSTELTARINPLIRRKLVA